MKEENVNNQTWTTETPPLPSPQKENVRLRPPGKQGDRIRVNPRESTNQQPLPEKSLPENDHPRRRLLRQADREYNESHC